MFKIRVVEQLNSSALLSAEKGMQLYELILKALENNSVISLDFSGYEYLSSTFLNRSFGRLCALKEWDFKEMQEHIKIETISKDDFDDIELSVVNARERMQLLRNGINLKEHYSSVYNY